jgi:hypothetical protein
MSDFYQSPADKLRFEILLKSLREGRLNLAILGDDEIALAHYGRRIFQHLREQGEQHVELWTSADSDRLVDRFNEILSTLTLDQALDKSNKSNPRRFMIFPDTQGIQDFELQLLARLINGFPASNINVILLVNSRSSYDKKLSAFGKNLLQWVLESKNPAPGQPQRLETLGDWPGAQQVPSVKKSEPKPPPVDIPLPAAPPPPLDLGEVRPGVDEDLGPRDLVLGDPLPDDPVMPSGEELAKSWEADRKSGRRGGQVAAFLLLALLVSLAVSGFVYQDLVMQEWQNLQTYLAGGKPQPTEAVKAPVQNLPKVTMSSSNSPPVKPADALSPDKEELVIAPEPAKAEATTPASTKTESAKPADKPVDKPIAEPAKPVAEPAKPIPKPADKPVDKPIAEPAKPVAEPAKPMPKPADKPVDKPIAEPAKPVAEPAKPMPKPADKPVDKATQADSPGWVNNLDSNAWVMQHGAFDSLSEARAFQSTSLGFKSGQVLFTQRKGSKPYYILVTGPYSEKAQAEALMKQNPSLSKAWLRTAKSLKAQFQE